MKASILHRKSCKFYRTLAVLGILHTAHQSSKSRQNLINFRHQLLCNHAHADTLLNLDSLLIQLKAEVTPRWYEFGKALGVNKAVLEKCIQYPPEESIVEILDNWLRNHETEPTWKEIAESLKMIGLRQLGSDIGMVYETGM